MMVRASSVALHRAMLLAGGIRAGWASPCSSIAVHAAPAAPLPRVIESVAVTACASAHRRSRFQSASHAGVGADPENDTMHALTMSQHCRCGESAEVFASRASQQGVRFTPCGRRRRSMLRLRS